MSCELKCRSFSQITVLAAWRIGRLSVGKARRGPKRKSKRGGLDVEAAIGHE